MGSCDDVPAAIMDERWMTKSRSRSRSRRCKRAWLLGMLLAFAPVQAAAQPEGPAASPQDGTSADSPQSAVDHAVARALLERATALFDQGDPANAKMLLAESLERSPRGPHAEEALQLLRQCNGQLGIGDRNHGVPPALRGTESPVDPYGGDSSETLDPYAEPDTAILDPYGTSPEETGGGIPVDTGGVDAIDNDAPASSAYDLARGQRVLMLYGGLYGFTAGMGVSGADSGGAVVTGLVGAGAGLAGAYFLARSQDISTAQASTIGWSGVWAGAASGLLADLVTGVDDTDAGDVFAGMALGGLVGTGAGWLLARKIDPSAGDVALVNSLGLFGATSSLLVGVGLDPAESEAYSLNALLGTALGLGAGMYMAPRVEVSRRRMLWVDLGAAAGALVPWIVLYPFIAGQEDASGMQAAGWLSTLGLFGGAYMAWRWTDGMDEEPLRIGRKQIATVPALLQRTEDGHWSLGMPALRAASIPALSPVSDRGLAMDILGGHF